MVDAAEIVKAFGLGLFVFFASQLEQKSTVWIPGPLPLDSTTLLYTISRSPEVLLSLTPFRVDLRYRPAVLHTASTQARTC